MQDEFQATTDSDFGRRTIPLRVLTAHESEPARWERVGYFALGLALFGFGALSIRRAFRSIPDFTHDLALSSLAPVPELQRTVTIRASMAEVELFFTDPPKLQGYELGRDLHLQLTMRPGPAGGGTELQGRLARWPSSMSADEADIALRDVLRSAKQLIEAGEIAVSS